MKKLCCGLLAAALLLTGLCACDRAAGEEGERFLLWFTAELGEDPSVWGAETYAGLSSVTYTGSMEIPAVMAALLAGPGGGGGLTSPIPEGTRLQNWSLTGGIVHLDLSGAYGSLTGVNATLADYCITLTLTQLDGVNGVRITVNGRALPGRSKQTLRRDDVVLSGAEEEPVELTAALCFRRTGGNELGEELRVFRLTENQSAPLAVLQALLAGPREAGLEALLPDGLEVYSARVEAGVCYADFSAVLLTGVPETEEEQQLVIRSIVGSLCSLGAVQAVQLLVEGQPLTYYGQVDVSTPLNEQTR